MLRHNAHKTNPILIGVVYRPPVQELILGHFNINVLDDSHFFKSYKEVCLLHGLKQIIESFTYITEKTSTLIDHKLINSVDMVS